MGPKMLAKSSKTAALEVHLTSSVNGSMFLDFPVTIATCNKWRSYMGHENQKKSNGYYCGTVVPIFKERFKVD